MDGRFTQFFLSFRSPLGGFFVPSGQIGIFISPSSCSAENIEGVTRPRRLSLSGPSIVVVGFTNFRVEKSTRNYSHFARLRSLVRASEEPRSSRRFVAFLLLLPITIPRCIQCPKIRSFCWHSSQVEISNQLHPRLLLSG